MHHPYLLVLQLVEPELLPGDVRAAMQSEYNTSYNTKADNTTLNQAVVQLAASIGGEHKTTARAKTSVLSKMMNAITKTIPYPLVMSAAYILGHGDSWCPMRCAKHDFSLFQRPMLQHRSMYDDQVADHAFIPGDNIVTQSSDYDGECTDTASSNGSDIGERAGNQCQVVHNNNSPCE